MTTLTNVPASPPASKILLRLRGLTERRAFWVLVDQGIVSAGNFVTIRSLAVYLSKHQFGLYNPLLETINYLNSLQAALVIYPLTIRGASTSARTLQRLATVSIIVTLMLLPLLGAGMATATGLIADWTLVPTGIAALVMWQLQETMRRGLMSNLRFADAVWGDAVSYLGQAAAVIAVGRAGRLNLNIVFIIMALTSLGGMAIQAAQIGLRRVNLRVFRAMIASFWKLGKWMLPNNAASIITAQGYWYTLLYFFGADSSALFGATVLFFKPANPIQSSMSSLIVPAVARAAKEGGLRAARRQAMRYIAFGATLLAPYFLLLALAPEWCISMAYRGHAAEYAGVVPMLRLYVANYTCVFFSAVLGAWLAGLGQSRFSFYAQIANIVATVLIGLPLTAKFGVMGLICGGLVSALACLVGSAWFLQRAPQTTDMASPEPQAAERLEVATQPQPQPIAAPPMALVLPPRPKLPPRKKRLR